MAALLIICIVGSIASIIVASEKHRNVFGWGILGFVMPAISVVAICCLPKIEPNPYRLDW
jgi:hypothetical protein